VPLYRLKRGLLGVTHKSGAEQGSPRFGGGEGYLAAIAASSFQPASASPYGVSGFNSTMKGFDADTDTLPH
jgi:hypothetical protein